MSAHDLFFVQSSISGITYLRFASQTELRIIAARFSMALTAGTKLGTYEIVTLLGKGGMGEVYRARDSKLKRDVAIKHRPVLDPAQPTITDDDKRPSPAACA